MRKYLSDRNLVIILFFLVFITFSFAHEDSKQLQQYSTQQSLSADLGTSIVPKKNLQASHSQQVKNSSDAVTR
ncbi:MAG: hypothetical protein JST10_16205 [Bacteroidetes bacterium]|nr:hypothetical protein [Bacteroidota bacterium]MBS1634108.1 hypothetical protein [Bacteroidota bacterium]